MFDPHIEAEIIQFAKHAGLDPAAILAIAEVESGGKATARVNDKDEPLIRFEGHYFDRRLTGTKRDQARAAGLANPKSGVIKNPKAQADRWVLLARAAKIDRQAAYESVSWGLGQVMGAHWKWLEFVSVDALVAECRRNVAGQIRLMLLYCEKAGLEPAIRKRDWAAFARGYNGPAYDANRYDKKLAAAYSHHKVRLENAAAGTSSKLSPVSPTSGKQKLGAIIVGWLHSLGRLSFS